MNQKRFDNLTRTLATSTSRRQALKLLGGSIAGALFAAFGGSTAQAAANQEFCRNSFCSGVPTKFRGKCLGTCMTCNLTTSTLCAVIGGSAGYSVACCPRPLICSASITAVCAAPES